MREREEREVERVRESYPAYGGRQGRIEDTRMREKWRLRERWKRGASTWPYSLEEP